MDNFIFLVQTYGVLIAFNFIVVAFVLINGYRAKKESFKLWHQRNHELTELEDKNHGKSI